MRKNIKKIIGGNENEFTTKNRLFDWTTKKIKRLKDATLKSTQNNIDKVVENTKIDNSVSNYKSQSKIDEIIKKNKKNLGIRLNSFFFYCKTNNFIL